MLLNYGVGENYWESLAVARRSNQSILKEISPEYSLEGVMLKLKLQHFDHLIWRTNLLEKILMLGNVEGKRRRGQERMKWLDGLPMWRTWVWVGSGNWWWTGKPGVLQSMGLKRIRQDWATELNWYIDEVIEICPFLTNFILLFHSYQAFKSSTPVIVLS